MTIATDALIKGNQLIHEYVNSGKQGFRNEIVDTEMKKILSNFRADCHITKSLLVTENVVRIDVADYEHDENKYLVTWHGHLGLCSVHFRVGVDQCNIYFHDTDSKTKIRTLLRRTFSVFRTCLDHNKAIMQLSEQYPECMDE